MTIQSSVRREYLQVRNISAKFQGCTSSSLSYLWFYKQAQSFKDAQTHLSRFERLFLVEFNPLSAFSPWLFDRVKLMLLLGFNHACTSHNNGHEEQEETKDQ